MANLPESWGLKTQKRADGKLDIVGKTDAGASYKVRTTDGPAVTDTDIAELRDADRESYSDRSTAAKQYVEKITNHGQRLKKQRDDAYGESLIDPAGEVMYAMLDRKGHNSPFTGSTSAFRRGWEYAFEKDN